MGYNYLFEKFSTRKITVMCEIELVNAIRFLMGIKMEISLIVNLKELMLIKLLVIGNLSYQCNLV